MQSGHHIGQTNINKYQITNEPRGAREKKKTPLTVCSFKFIFFLFSKHRLSLFFYSINTQKLVTDIPVLILDGVRSSVGTVKSDPDYHR